MEIKLRWFELMVLAGHSFGIPGEAEELLEPIIRSKNIKNVMPAKVVPSGGRDGLSHAIYEVLMSQSQSFVDFMEIRDLGSRCLLVDSIEARNYFGILDPGCAPILYVVDSEAEVHHIVDLKSSFPSAMGDRRTLLYAITAIVRNSAGRIDNGPPGFDEYGEYITLDQMTSRTIMQDISTVLWFVTAPFIWLFEVVTNFLSSFFQ